MREIMGRTSAEEIESLKIDLTEKNRLLEQQMTIINQQLEAFDQLSELQAKLKDYEFRLLENQRTIQMLVEENTRLQQFRNKVQTHWFVRLMHWFRDAIS